MGFVFVFLLLRISFNYSPVESTAAAIELHNFVNRTTQYLSSRLILFGHLILFIRKPVTFATVCVCSVHVHQNNRTDPFFGSILNFSFLFRCTSIRLPHSNSNSIYWSNNNSCFRHFWHLFRNQMSMCNVRTIFDEWFGADMHKASLDFCFIWNLKKKHFVKNRCKENANVNACPSD